MKSKKILMVFILSLVLNTSYSQSDTLSLSAYISFKSEHKDDYQALYMSQTKGIFYMLYGRFNLNSTRDSLKSIDFKVINYNHAYPFKKPVGFITNEINSEVFNINDKTSELTFKLPIKRFFKTLDSASVNLEDKKIKISNLKGMHIKRFFVKYKKDILNFSFYSKKEENRIQKCSNIQGAVSLNCGESKLKFIINK